MVARDHELGTGNGGLRVGDRGYRDLAHINRHLAQEFTDGQSVRLEDRGLGDWRQRDR